MSYNVTSRLVPRPIKATHPSTDTSNVPATVTAFNYALGEVEENQEINISQHSPSSSLLPMANLHTEVFAGTGFKEKETVIIKKLDQVFTDFNVSGKFMVKIDVQGFEDKVIKGGIETLKKADCILIETSFEELYQGQLLFDGIYQLLTQIGFVFKGNYTQALNKQDGRILYAESLFTKN